MRTSIVNALFVGGAVINVTIAGMALAGCGTPPAHAASPQAPASASQTAPAATASATPASPISVKILYAGPLTVAQQNQYGAGPAGSAPAAPAAIYSVTNVSGAPVTPDVTIQFLNGSTVVSSGFAGEQPELMPGQTETAAAGDSIDGGGTGQTWTSVNAISVENESPPDGTYQLTGVTAKAAS
jgi:hypothetical protein